MTPSIKAWIELAVEQSSTVLPLQPLLPPCERLLDSAIPSGERDALEEKVWQALDAQFPWLSMVGQDPTLHADGINEFARLIRWLKMSIANWDMTASNLVELVFTMARLSARNELIEALPPTFISNPAFLEALASVICHAPPAEDLSLWSNRGDMKTALERLDMAWEGGQWSEVVRYYDATGYFLPATLFATSVKMLARWSFTTLVSLSDDLQDCYSAYAISFALARCDALQLAAATSSETVRFGCVYSKLHASREMLTACEMAILSNVFEAASRDARIWRGWMEIFNRYPVRFPQIQSALGGALATMPARALFVYIDALELHTRPNDERALVAECLSRFAGKADKRKRAAVWKRAHQRWKGWNFDHHKSDGILTDISCSALDYALTGFYLESCTNVERDSLASDLRDQLVLVDAGWHVSLIACATQWYRVQSQLQPVLQSQKVVTSQSSWLSEKLYIVSPIDDPALYFDRKHLIVPRR